MQLLTTFQVGVTWSRKGLNVIWNGYKRGTQLLCHSQMQPTMSYASVASHNAPPLSQQPRPDPSLLNVQSPTADNIADDAAKVNVVSSDFKTNPATYTSEGRMALDDKYNDPIASDNDMKKRSNKGYKEAGAEGGYVWNVINQYLFRPSVVGGLIGLVNVGIISGVGHVFYTEPRLRRDAAVISSAVAGAIALLSLEGYAAERYHKTPRGQDEERKAKEGALLYRHAREIVLRPGILGGLVGLLNTAILGSVGYYSYLKWDKPSWDRRTVSAVSAGLLTLWGSEEYLTKRNRETTR